MPDVIQMYFFEKRLNTHLDSTIGEFCVRFLFCSREIFFYFGSYVPYVKKYFNLDLYIQTKLCKMKVAMIMIQGPGVLLVISDLITVYKYDVLKTASCWQKFRLIITNLLLKRLSDIVTWPDVYMYLIAHV